MEINIIKAKKANTNNCDDENTFCSTMRNQRTDKCKFGHRHETPKNTMKTYYNDKNNQVNCDYFTLLPPKSKNKILSVNKNNQNILKNELVRFKNEKNDKTRFVDKKQLYSKEINKKSLKKFDNTKSNESSKIEMKNNVKNVKLQVTIDKKYIINKNKVLKKEKSDNNLKIVSTTKCNGM